MEISSLSINKSSLASAFECYLVFDDLFIFRVRLFLRVIQGFIEVGMGVIWWAFIWVGFAGFL